MKTLIAGYGKSGKSAESFLKSKGYEVEVLKEEILNKTHFESDELDRLFKGLSFIVKSPGVPSDLLFFKEARKRRLKVVGEFELGANNCKGDVIAVTGTNGKTTTVSLIKFLLQEWCGNVFLGGNIGVPVTSFCENTMQGDIIVLECSSFQLERITRFRPKISAILNISPDHLNRHKTFLNYVKCKYNITKHQTQDDYLILNADDEYLAKNPPKTKANVYYFSTKNKVVGCYAKNGFIFFNDGAKSRKIASVKRLKILGEHNLSNALCAVLVVWIECQNRQLFKNLENFEAVEHRIEFVKRVGQVDFYNDSKATNISSTLSALNSFKVGVNLILGGSDKGYEFDELFLNIPKGVKNIAVFGETKQKILYAAERCGFKNVYACESLGASVNLLFSLARQGEVVLLSPACASFDCFSNYEERGNCFKRIVEGIYDKN